MAAEPRGGGRRRCKLITNLQFCDRRGLCQGKNEGQWKWVIYAAFLLLAFVLKEQFSVQSISIDFV